MIDEIEHRNGKVYLVLVSPDWTQPRWIKSYYETDADPSIIPAGVRVTQYVESYEWQSEHGRRYTLRLTDPKRMPAFTEFEAIPKPRGRWRWVDGEWSHS